MSEQALTLTQQGWQKLSAGDLDGAVETLTRAIMANDKDADAKALLGMAYSQKGLHAQAKRALQTAVESQPGNADFRCNLGVVLERAGELPAAAQAYQQALQINGHHELSRQRLHAIGHVAPPPQPASPPQPPFQQHAPPAAAPAQTIQGFGGRAPAPQQSPWQPAPSAPVHGAAPATSPAAQSNAPGKVTCARCGQQTNPGLSCEWCSTPLPPPAPPQRAPAGPWPSNIEPAVAYATIDAVRTESRNRGNNVFQNWFMMRLVMAGVGLVISLIVGAFKMTMRAAARQRETSTISLSVNGQSTQFQGAAATFDASDGGHLSIESSGSEDPALYISMTAQASTPSQMSGKTLTSTNSLTTGQVDLDDIPDVITVAGHTYYGERVSANVSTASDKQITLALDGSFREADENTGQFKPPVPLFGTVTLKLAKE